MIRSFAAALLAICTYTCVFGQTPTFFDGHHDGWLFYNDPVFVEPTPEAPSDLRPDSVSTPLNDEDKPFSTAWIRKELPLLLDRATEHPTPQNIRAALYVQRLMMDRAERFQQVANMVVNDDPLLDSNSRYPMAQAGSDVANEEAQRSSREVIANLSKTAGIWFFFRSDCHFCMAEEPILAMLERSTGMTVYAVSVDGGPPPGGMFSKYVTDTGQAASLGVEGTPALFLVRPPDFSDIVPLGQGFLSLEEIVTRIVTQAYFKGWIDEKAFDATRIFQAKFLDPGVRSAKLEHDDNPADLIALIKGSMTAIGGQDAKAK